MRLPVLLSAWLFIAASLTAQATTYGTPAELRGIHRVFVFSGDEIDVRNNIVTVLKKHLPSVTVVERPEDAEVMLVFAASSGSIITGYSTTASGNTSVNRVHRTDGTGLVIRPETGGGRRILMKYEDSRTFLWERRPSTNFARAFARAFEDANK